MLSASAKYFEMGRGVGPPAAQHTLLLHQPSGHFRGGAPRPPQDPAWQRGGPLQPYSRESRNRQKCRACNGMRFRRQKMIVPRLPTTCCCCGLFDVQAGCISGTIHGALCRRAFQTGKTSSKTFTSFSKNIQSTMSYSARKAYILMSGLVT